MTIDLHAVRAALKDASRDADRARVFVRSEHLDVPRERQPELRLMRALQNDPRARITVRGSAGSGKTSLIVHVLGHLPAFRRKSPAHVIVRLQVGGNPASFGSADALQHAVLEAILAAAQRPDEDLDVLSHGIDLSELATVVADSVTTTAATDDRTLQLSARPPLATFAIARTLRGERAALQASATPRARSEALRRALQVVAAHEAMVTVIIDDTEHFATGNAIGDDSGIRALYAAVSTLAELDLQLVVGFHPKFDEVADVRATVQRSSFDTIDVTSLPHHDNSLAPILDRRFGLNDLDIATADAFEPAAVVALEAIYHDGARHDYRRVLRAAQHACTIADTRGATRVQGVDVKQSLEGL